MMTTYRVNFILTLEDLRRARARQRSCRWPTENDIPDSFMRISSPPAASTSSFTWHFSKAFQIFKSSCIWNGSRLSLNKRTKKKGHYLFVIDKYYNSNEAKVRRSIRSVHHKNTQLDYLNDPSNRNGLWGTTAKCERSSLTGISLMFTPSMRMEPVHIGVSRKRAFNKLDFPAPVLPIIPIWLHATWKVINIMGVINFRYLQQQVRYRAPTCFPPAILKLRLQSAGGKDGLYFKVTLWNSITPWFGQPGFKRRLPACSSWGMSIY